MDIAVMLQQNLTDSVRKGRLFHYICLHIRLIFFSHWMCHAFHLWNIYTAREHKRKFRMKSTRLGRRIFFIFIQQSIKKLYPHQILGVALQQLAWFLFLQREFSLSWISNTRRQHHLLHPIAISPLEQGRHQPIYTNWRSRNSVLNLSEALYLHPQWMRLWRKWSRALKWLCKMPFYYNSELISFSQKISTGKQEGKEPDNSLKTEGV